MALLNQIHNGKEAGDCHLAQIFLSKVLEDRPPLLIIEWGYTEVRIVPQLRPCPKFGQGLQTLEAAVVFIGRL